MTDDEPMPGPTRPGRSGATSGFTHTVFAFRRIGKKFGRYLECGVARVPTCEHCGEPISGKIKVFVDRLVAFGGGTGGFLIEPNGNAPPQLERDFPEQAEFDEKDILPGSG
jgi:hypothetical protein